MTSPSATSDFWERSRPGKQFPSPAHIFRCERDVHNLIYSGIIVLPQDKPSPFFCVVLTPMPSVSTTFLPLFVFSVENSVTQILHMCLHMSSHVAWKDPSLSLLIYCRLALYKPNLHASPSHLAPPNPPRVHKIHVPNGVHQGSGNPFPQCSGEQYSILGIMHHLWHG